MRSLIAMAKEVEKSSGCQISIDETYVEEPFREDPSSLLVGAISGAVLKISGFEPIFEWLPFPVSTRELKTSGFASDVVAFGPGDWAPITTPNEKSIVSEILQASRILASIPHEATILDEKGQLDKIR
jgi:acetylornithine deacetylase/succinyl-diaminopimelate desuccinylase-like protein